MKKFWEIKNKGNKEGELLIYSEISSDSWWGDETTPKKFKEDLDNLGEIDTLNIYINSPGGDVFAGVAIYNMLKRHKANKVVYIDGLAASIASVIAMAGDTIIMPRNAMIMIHKAWTFVGGNADDMRKMAENLDNIDVAISGSYERTGLNNEEILALMKSETWLTADEAIEKGFADELEVEKEIAACIGSDFFNRYKNVPEILIKNEENAEILVKDEKKPDMTGLLAVYEQKIKLNKRRNL